MKHRMKLYFSLVMLMCLASFAFAADNPLYEYFNNPGEDSYRLAVTSLCEAIAKGENSNANKINLAFISQMEASRLGESMQAVADSLAPGERFALANMLLAQEKYASAVELYNKINAETPNWSCPWRHKGEALYKLKNYKAAEKALQEAIATNEQHYDAYLWLAFTQYELKQYKKAWASLEKARSLSPNAEESADQAISDTQLQELSAKLRKKLHKA